MYVVNFNVAASEEVFYTFLGFQSYNIFLRMNSKRASINQNQVFGDSDRDDQEIQGLQSNKHYFLEDDDKWERIILKEKEIKTGQPYFLPMEEPLSEENIDWVEWHPEQEQNGDEKKVEKPQKPSSSYQSCVLRGVKPQFLKNNNVPKILNREFLATFQRYLDLQGVCPLLRNEIIAFLKKEKAKYYEEDQYGNKKVVKNINYNLQSLKRLYGSSQDSLNPKLRSHILRKAVNKFIREQNVNLALGHEQISMKKEYLFRLKLQAHRFRNEGLITRTQIQ